MDIYVVSNPFSIKSKTTIHIFSHIFLSTWHCWIKDYVYLQFVIARMLLKGSYEFILPPALQESSYYSKILIATQYFPGLLGSANL